MAWVGDGEKRCPCVRLSVCPNAPGSLFPTRRELLSTGRAAGRIRAAGMGLGAGASCPAGDLGGFRRPRARFTSTERPQSPLCLSAPALLNSAMSRQPRVAITPTTLRSLRSPEAWRRQTTPLSRRPRPSATKPCPSSSQTPPPAACGVRGLAEGCRPRPRPPAGGDVRRAPRRGNEWEAGGAGGTAAAPRPGRHRHRHRHGTARLGLGSAAAGTGAACGRGPARRPLLALFSPLRRPRANKMMQSSALAAEGAVKGLPEILGVPVQRKDAFLFSPDPLPAARC